MKFLIFFFSILPLFLSEPCSEGPSFWCDSISNAASCKAVSHCQETVWRNEVITKDKSNPCDFCKTVVNDVIELLNINETELLIKNFLKTTCNLIPNADLSVQCLNTIDKYYDEVTSLINLGLDPGTICSLIRVCQSSYLHKHPFPPPFLPTSSSDKKEPLCGDCVKFVSDLINDWFSDNKKKQLNHIIDHVLCEKLNLSSHVCEIFAEKFIIDMMDQVKQKIDPEDMCGKFCIGRNSDDHVSTLMRIIVVSYVKASVKDSDECEICKKLIDDVKELLKDKATQKIIKDFLNKYMCDNLREHRKQCEDMVETYSTVAFDFIIDQLDAETKCETIGFCHKKSSSSSSSIKDSPSLKWIPLVKAKKVSDFLYSSSSSSVSSLPQCEFCKYLVKQIEKLVENPKSEEEIINAVDKVCYLLPSKEEKRCEDMVKMYGKMLIEILLKDFNPKTVCISLSLCSFENKIKKNKVETILSSVLSPSSKSSPSPKSLKLNPVFCEICQIMMQYLESLLDSNDSILEVEIIVKKVCNLLPNHYKQDCDNMVDEFGGLIIQYLISNFPPKKICKLLDLCNEEKRIYYKCLAGPSYWCSSPQNAKLCQAEEHCTKYIWKKINLL